MSTIAPDSSCGPLVGVQSHGEPLVEVQSDRPRRRVLFSFGAMSKGVSEPLCGHEGREGVDGLGLEGELGAPFFCRVRRDLTLHLSPAASELLVPSPPRCPALTVAPEVTIVTNLSAIAP